MKQKAFDFSAMQEEPSHPSYLDSLNEAQQSAVSHFTGPILVLAGAGSGKTRVLTHRVAHLVHHHNVHPSQILAVTFTNKATSEMKERLKDMLGQNADRLWVSTFHSACLRILRRHPEAAGYKKNFVIYDDRDTKSVLKEVLKEQSINEKEFPVDDFKRRIDRLKNKGISPEAYSDKADGFHEGLHAQVYTSYQRHLLLSNAMDFGDLLLNTVRLFTKNSEILAYYQRQLQFILVDEFQDTNEIQYRLIRMLANPQQNLLVVGDDDQSIYAFRGASIRNILDFEKDFPEAKTVILEENYRSTANILDLAYSVIKGNKDRKPKKLRSNKGQGESIIAYTAYDESEEAGFIASEIKELMTRGIALDDIAIFYRTNFQSRALEEALLNKKIPYRIFGGLKFYDRKEIKDVLSYLKLLTNPSDRQSFLRVLNTPPRGIGAASVKKIIEKAEADSSTLWDAASTMVEQKKIAAFIRLMKDIQEYARQYNVSKLIEYLVEQSGYKKRLKESKDRQDQSRLENIQELQAVAQVTVPLDTALGGGLELFLDRVSLSSGSDDDNGEEGGVSLMTLHLAKGLEYPYVFLTGLEEGLLPHHRSQDSEHDIEEERRLCYVGITRAMVQLYLSRARSRGFYSTGGAAGGRFREGSRFIQEMEPSVITVKGSDFYEDPRIEYDEIEEYHEQSQSPFRGQASKFRQQTDTNKPKKSGLNKAFGHLLSRADALEESTTADLTEGLNALTPGEEAEGLRIVHPVFGKGTIVEIDTRPSVAPVRRKVIIDFDELSRTRKLIIGKAKLHLLEEG